MGESDHRTPEGVDVTTLRGSVQWQQALRWVLVALAIMTALTLGMATRKADASVGVIPTTTAAHVYDAPAKSAQQTQRNGTHEHAADPSLSGPQAVDAAKLVLSPLNVIGAETEATTLGDLAETPVGRRGSPLDVPRGANSPATISGRSFGGHALDEMQSEGFTPGVVNDAITNGEVSVGSSGRVAYYSRANNLTVITENEKVITVSSGALKIR